MRFFILEPTGGELFGTQWTYADQVDPVIHGKGRNCPACGRSISSLEWLPPHRIRLSSAKPKEWGDFVWGAGFRLMVSERFKNYSEIEQLTGIEHFYPSARIVRVGRQMPEALAGMLPKYYLVQIKWNSANLDDEASEVVRKENPLHCKFDRGPIRAYERVVLESDSWDGSDIFEARGLFGVTIVSERFRDLVEKYALTNAWLIPAENYAYREIGGWYVRDPNESDEETSISRGK